MQSVYSVLSLILQNHKANLNRFFAINSSRDRSRFSNLQVDWVCFLQTNRFESVLPGITGVSLYLRRDAKFFIKQKSFHHCFFPLFGFHCANKFINTLTVMLCSSKIVSEYTQPVLLEIEPFSVHFFYSFCAAFLVLRVVVFTRNC